MSIRLAMYMFTDAVNHNIQTILLMMVPFVTRWNEAAILNAGPQSGNGQYQVSL